MNKAFKPTNTQQAVARQEEEIPKITNKDIDFYIRYLKKYNKSTILVYNSDIPAYGEITLLGFNAFSSFVPPPPPIPVKNFQGSWNALANSPPIPPASAGPLGNSDFYYYVSVAGTSNIDGTSSWQVGDIILSIGSKWVKIGTQTNLKYKTRILTTAIINSGTPILTNSSGFGFTKTLDNTFLGTTIGVFNSNHEIRVLRNGNELSKGDGLNYITSVSFSLNSDLAIDEVLEIYSDLTI